MKDKKEKVKPSKKFRKGDVVVAISGNHKGQTGEVLERRGNRLIVQGLNMKKKHTKPSGKMQQGGIISREAPIQESNLMLCPSGEKGVRLRIKSGDDGERQLYYLEGDKEMTYRPIKKVKG